MGKQRKRAKAYSETVTAERHQHDEIETMASRAQRVVHPLEKMAKRDTLSDPKRQVAAAFAWLGDYEVGIMGARNAEEMPHGVQRSGTPNPIPAEQVEAARRYGDGLRAMGRHIAWVAKSVVMGRATLAELEQGSGIDRKKLAAMLDVALLNLADTEMY